MGKEELFWDPSQPNGQPRRAPLLLTARINKEQNLRAINIYLRLSANFEWNQLPIQIGERRISAYAAVLIAKATALAADSYRPYGINYPHTMFYNEHTYISDPSQDVHANRVMWATKHRLPLDFRHTSTPSFLTPHENYNTPRPQRETKIRTPHRLSTLISQDTPGTTPQVHDLHSHSMSAGPNLKLQKYIAHGFYLTTTLQTEKPSPQTSAVRISLPADTSKNLSYHLLHSSLR